MIDILKHINIFSDLDDGEIKLIINYFTFHNIKKHTLLFNHGDVDRRLFIVLKGKIIVSNKMPDGSEKIIDEISDGNFFGEMSLFENAPRSADCFAENNSHIITIDENQFDQVINNYPELAIHMMYKILNITTSRFTERSKFLSEIVQYGEKARKRTITDELTGAYNRRFLDDAFFEHFNYAKNHKSCLTIVMIDVDYFRDINNEFGQSVGDSVLKEIVVLIKKYLTENDILARYGGDEFVILLPDMNADSALKIVEKIRCSCEELSLSHVDPQLQNTISLSMGLASFPEHSLIPSDLRAKVDESLYKAKENGRNRVECAVK